MSAQTGKQNAKPKPKLSFGISSILGNTADCDHKDNVNDTDQQEVRRNLLALTALGGSLRRTDMEINPENRLKSLGYLDSRDQELMTASIADSDGTAKCDTSQETESPPARTEEESSMAAAAFQLMPPCLTSHALMIKPLDRYRSKGLGEYSYRAQISGYKILPKSSQIYSVQ